MAEDTVDQRLERIEAAIAAMRGEMAGFAKGADITLLQRRVEQGIAESRAVRTDLRLLTGMVTSMLSAVQAIADHQIQLADRVSALETPPEAP